ncbi:MAG: response regulator [Microthrixaceae bacterium]
MRVLIVDDHQMFAASLARLLSDTRDLELCGTCSTLAELPARLGTDRPDMIVADWNLADGTGAGIAALVKTHLPSAKIVVVTGETDPAVARLALEAGCDGFVTKDKAPEELLTALRAAARGDLQVTPQAIAAIRHGDRHLNNARASLGLSEREMEVVELLANSWTNRQIADALYLSPNTVRNHVHRIAGKLGVSTRLEIVLRAADAGVVNLGAEARDDASARSGNQGSDTRQ